MNEPLFVLELAADRDVVTARQAAREIAAALGFESQDQTRIATAVSEIARNVTRYAGRGRLEARVEGRTVPQVLAIRIADRGPGIKDLESILSGRYRSTTGMGLGLSGARRLMDQVDIDTAPGRGTVILLKKILPLHGPLVDEAAVERLRSRVRRAEPANPIVELQQQNRELIRALDELRLRQEELTRLNHELEDTNRGVVALYAELDEKADHLRRADEMKSRFLSNMSHEFRTPLNSILAISRILADRTDGPLTDEQEKQVGFIRRAAEDLAELVNDLLDLAKVEAGKIVVSPAEFEVRNLFGALRGMLRPLLVSDQVTLVFDEPQDLPPLFTDEGKVSQILRNFISNALKFTERGEVRVGATHDAGTGMVTFRVRDTGIGIDPRHHARIFEEFGQVENPLQRRHRGTGLGLPLSKRLAELLGGSLGLASAPGQGSTFTATIPAVFPGADPLGGEAAEQPDPSRRPVLVVEDAAAETHVYERLLRGSAFQPFFARSVREARERLAAVQPVAIVLDIVLGHEESWALLAELKSGALYRPVPVIVATSVDDPAKARALNADAYADKPIQRGWLLETLARLARGGRVALVVDDDETARYALRSLLRGFSVTVVEAVDGPAALQLAREAHPDLVLVDLVMPGMSGFEVVEALCEPNRPHVPIVVISSKTLSPDEESELARRGVPFLSKGELAAGDAVQKLGLALGRAGWR